MKRIASLFLLNKATAPIFITKICFKFFMRLFVVLGTKLNFCFCKILCQLPDVHKPCEKISHRIFYQKMWPMDYVTKISSCKDNVTWQVVTFNSWRVCRWWTFPIPSSLLECWPRTFGNSPWFCHHTPHLSSLTLYLFRFTW